MLILSAASILYLIIHILYYNPPSPENMVSPGSTVTGKKSRKDLNLIVSFVFNFNFQYVFFIVVLGSDSSEGLPFLISI